MTGRSASMPHSRQLQRWAIAWGIHQGGAQLCLLCGHGCWWNWADMAVVGYQQLDSCFYSAGQEPKHRPVSGSVRNPRGCGGTIPDQLLGDADYAGFNGRGDVDEIIAAIIAVLQTAQRIRVAVGAAQGNKRPCRAWSYLGRCCFCAKPSLLC